MRLRSRLGLLIGVCAMPGLGVPVLAQDVGAPMSAIDWMSRSVESPQALMPVTSPLGAPNMVQGTAISASPPAIEVRPLGGPSADNIGLLPPALTGLPRGIWAASEERALIDLIAKERSETIPAIQELLITLLLAEADPPLGAGPTAELFLARIDKLLELGALEPAQALLELADPSSPALFRRWFDVALLTGTEAPVCDMMRDRPGIAPTYPARIFCLARGGDWQAASLILNTGRAIGDIDDESIALLDRFLDPAQYDGAEPLPPPSRTSPLVFRMREAIGERLTTAPLPRAFAHADLGDIAGWRNQLEAAERLARAGAISPSTLQELYTAHIPAASGGVWDRASAFQRFDVAVKSGDPGAISGALPRVWAAMQEARTEVPFAELYATALARQPITGPNAQLAYRIRLLSKDYETAALALTGTDPADIFLAGLAKGRIEGALPRGARERAVEAAFAGAPVPIAIKALLDQDKLGEALLEAILLFDRGQTGDPAQITAALSVLRAVGLEDIARRAALQYLLLDRAG